VTDPDDPISRVTIGITPPWEQFPYLDDMSPVVGSNIWRYTIIAGSGGSDSQVKYTVTAHDSHGNSKSLSASSDNADPSYIGYAPNGCLF
jgi:hypothetical protein